MDGAITLLLVVGAICLAVIGWAGRKRFPLRIGAGNFFRRKTQVAIVVAGLLIGTAIVSSSFVIQSTFDFTVRAAVFRALDAVDEVVFAASPDGGRLPFSAQVYDNLSVHLASMPTVDKIAPRYQLPAAVIDSTTQLFEPTATVGGFDWEGETGRINTIAVANVGGPKGGYLRSDDVVREMTPFLPQTPTFTISKAKADSIDGASRNIDQLSQVFVLLGFFTVIAGILLIINIFVMLAEERKGEMGVARALGMRRKNLVQSFV